MTSFSSHNTPLYMMPVNEREIWTEACVVMDMLSHSKLDIALCPRYIFSRSAKTGVVVYAMFSRGCHSSWKISVLGGSASSVQRKLSWKRGLGCKSCFFANLNSKSVCVWVCVFSFALLLAMFHSEINLWSEYRYYINDGLFSNSVSVQNYYYYYCCCLVVKYWTQDRKHLTVYKNKRKEKRILLR